MQSSLARKKKAGMAPALSTRSPLVVIARAAARAGPARTATRRAEAARRVAVRAGPARAAARAITTRGLRVDRAGAMPAFFLRARLDCIAVRVMSRVALCATDRSHAM